MGRAAIGCNFYAVGGRSAASPLFAGTVQNQKFFCPCAPTPTPTPIVSVSGTVTYCSNPANPSVPGVTVNLTGPTPAPTSTLTDSSGNYTLSGLFTGSTYAVTPTKATLTSGANGINTIDVIATQKHFLNTGTPLSGCRLLAADVNADSAVNTVDAIAIQRFFLGLTTGIANVGRYDFTPPNRGYMNLVTNQTAQGYDTLVFGDYGDTPGREVRALAWPSERRDGRPLAMQIDPHRSRRLILFDFFQCP
jgi:hypothetical protein